MKSVFLHEAELEMAEAAEFYEIRKAGLGSRFLDAIERAVTDVKENPQRWPILSHRLHRRLGGRSLTRLSIESAGKKLRSWQWHTFTGTRIIG
jgi:hypothetical protein